MEQFSWEKVLKQGVKRPYPDVLSFENVASSVSVVKPDQNGVALRKRRKNAVSDVLSRQQILSSLVRAQTLDSSRTKDDDEFFKHINTCDQNSCSFPNCELGKRCFQHFEKCLKEGCILCVEARLLQTVKCCIEVGMSENELFMMSAWKARLHSVNDETREFVPYFNRCADELAVAKATKSPFIQSQSERYLAAQALVTKSESKYSSICSEIYQKWVKTRDTLQTPPPPPPLPSLQQPQFNWSTPSMMTMMNPTEFGDVNAEKKSRIVNKMFLWSNKLQEEGSSTGETESDLTIIDTKKDELAVATSAAITFLKAQLPGRNL